MYTNFSYYAPTKVVFGKDAENHVGELLQEQRASKVLLHYGGSHAEKSGLLARIMQSLDAVGIPYVRLGGVVPNPQLSLVYQGIELCRREGVDFILAVGGGSVIDSAKAIGYGALEDGDVWDFFEHVREVKVCLPIGVVLTIAAAGSEMSNGCVITNDKTGQKRAGDSELNRPKFAVMNPELTMSLPLYQTSCGIADMMMHTMERYFNQADNMEITDAVSESILRNIMKYGRILMEQPRDYVARAEIMWSGSLAHNGLTGCGTGGGDWACHILEHEISGMFGVPHGAGLAAIWGSWARYVNHRAKHRFVKFARKVHGIEDFADEDEGIARGIAAMEDFFRAIHMPTTLKELGVAPSEEQIAQMADGALAAYGGDVGTVLPLKREDIIRIYQLAR